MEEHEQRDRSWSGSSNSWSIVDGGEDGLQAHSESDNEEDSDIEAAQEVAEDAVEPICLPFCLLPSNCSSKNNVVELEEKELLQELISIHSSSSSCTSQHLTNMSIACDHTSDDQVGSEGEEEDVDIHQDSELSPRELEEDDDASITTTTEIEEEGVSEEEQEDEESEMEDLCLVSEQEILEENSAAKHFIEPGRVTQTLDELSRKSDPLMHRLLDTLLFFTATKTTTVRVINWLLISLIVSTFGAAAIYQILEHSWMAGDKQEFIDPSHYYFNLPSTMSSSSSAELLSDLPDMGLQSPLGLSETSTSDGGQKKKRLSHEEATKKYRRSRYSVCLARENEKNPATNDDPEDAEGIPELEPLETRGTPSDSPVNHLISLQLTVTHPHRNPATDKNLRRHHFSSLPNKQHLLPPLQKSSQVKLKSKPQDDYVFKHRLVDKPVFNRKHLPKEQQGFNRHFSSQAHSRVVEVQQVYEVFPATAESSFFGDKQRVRDMKQGDSSTLQQCRLQLNDAKSAFASKDKVLHFVRLRKEKQQEMVIQQLKAQLAEAQRQLADASKIHPETNRAAETQETCFAEHTEQVLANLTRSLKEKTSNFIQSVHSFTNTTTSLSRFVQKTGKFSVKSLTKMSSWLRNQTKKINQQSFVQQTQQNIKFLQSSWQEIPDFSIFKTVPKFMDSLLHENWQNHMQTLVSSVSTALAPIFEHNFSLHDHTFDDDEQEERDRKLLYDPINFPCYDQVEEDGAIEDNNLPHKLHRRNKSKKRLPSLLPPPPPLSNFLCDSSFAIAEALRATEQFGLQIGIKEANKYIGYLVNLPRKQCTNDSSLLICEKCWWTNNCTPLTNCPLRRWQRDRKVNPVDILLTSPKLQTVFDQLGWIASFQQPHSKNKSQPTPPPSNSGKQQRGHRNDWLVERSNLRETLRQRQKLQLVEEAQINWLLARAKHRQQMRQKQEEHNLEGGKPRRRPSSPYSMKWKKKSWKADADWLLVRAIQRANLRQSVGGNEEEYDDIL